MQCGSSSGLVLGESSAVEAFDKCLARWMLRKTLVSSYPTILLVWLLQVMGCCGPWDDDVREHHPSLQIIVAIAMCPG